MTDFKHHIRQLIHEGKTSEAIGLLNQKIDASPVKDDEWYYLRGNAYRRQSDWQQALNNYLEAISLNPQSPAKEAHRMLMEILEFYNKDMYNQ